jgi:hypothetical protein
MPRLFACQQFRPAARLRQGSHHDHTINKKEKQPMKQKIINYIRAGYPGLYIVSPEEQRVAVEMTQIAKDLKYNLVFWSAV